ncbi:hypothetical protein DPMN_046040 [Dreissena polymorpha]|uniref:Uncharacterized protein n=1 Tax=Dreissena polymorpha TaxID=45954 RepID=A0A9D4I087_DREPO|nr:hypothetical protein DPMN_046040 [Dreissena polymorpha]
MSYNVTSKPETHYFRPPTDHLPRSRSKLPRLWSHDGVVIGLRSWKSLFLENNPFCHQNPTAKLHAKNGRRRQQHFESVRFVVQKRDRYPLRSCYQNQEPAGGKARAIGDRGKLAEKVAGDCGSHKRVLGGVEDGRHM